MLQHQKSRMTGILMSKIQKCELYVNSSVIRDHTLANNGMFIFMTNGTNFINPLETC